MSDEKRRKKLKRAKRRAGDKIEDITLNLLPFMNLMTLLIPFLLLSASFITIAVIDSSLPAIGQPQPKDKLEEDKEPPLNLQIAITDEGFTVSGSSPLLGCGEGGTGDSENTCKQIPLNQDEAITVDLPGGKSKSSTYCKETQCGGVSSAGCIPDKQCHDFKALKELITSLKKPEWKDGAVKLDYPEEENVILAPNNNIEYGILVGVMDATRDVEPSKEIKDGVQRVCTNAGEKKLVLPGQGDKCPKGAQSTCAPNVCLFPNVVIAGGVK